MMPDVAVEAFLHALAIPLFGQPAFFAALVFGGYQPFLLVAAALLGALPAVMVNWGAGRLLAPRFDRRFLLYAQAPSVKQRMAFILPYLLLACWLPFMGLAVLVAGLFRLPLWRVLCFSGAGWLSYYLYWLWKGIL